MSKKPTTVAKDGKAPAKTIATMKAAAVKADQSKLNVVDKSVEKNQKMQDVDTVAGTDLKKKELLALVAERSDVKKKYVKPAVEAMIEILGEAFSQGREINLQPMGKITPKRAKDTDQVRIMIAKIRQSKTRGDQADAADKPADTGDKTG